MRDNNIIQDAINTLKRLHKENAELKAENKELAHYLACMTEQRNKANTCLQEIKKIVEQIINKNEFVYQNHRDIRQIIRLINESEE